MVEEKRKNLIRSMLEKQDKGTLDKRIDRWVNAGTGYYSESTGLLVDIFYDEAFESFVQARFIGTIVLCDSINEAILKDRMKLEKVYNIPAETKRALEQGLINEDQKQNIDWLRALRNGIVHGDPSTLSRYEKNRERRSGETSIDDATYGYLKGNRSVEENAQWSLRCALELIKQIYRTK